YAFRLAGNAMEASLLVRTEMARKYGYGPNSAAEHQPLLDGLNKEGGIRTRDFGPWASYVYRWGQGMFHISGSFGNGTPEQRTADWLARNQDHGDGRPLEP